MVQQHVLSAPLDVGDGRARHPYPGGELSLGHLQGLTPGGHRPTKSLVSRIDWHEQMIAEQRVMCQWHKRYVLNTNIEMFLLTSNGLSGKIRLTERWTKPLKFLRAPPGVRRRNFDE